MENTIKTFLKEKTFEGKNVIVTGGTGGIGSRIAESFLKCGAKVVVISKTEKKVLTKFGNLKNNHRKILKIT